MSEEPLKEMLRQAAESSDGLWSKAHVVTQPGRSQQQVGELYDQWATCYDQDIGTVETRFEGIAQVLHAVLQGNTEARVLDVGAGTGLLGHTVYNLGYHNLDALDGSSKMLEEAGKKNIYVNTICAFLGEEKTAIPEKSYDALVMTGVFRDGHLNHTCFKELIRITKPGGFIVMAVYELALQSDASLQQMKPTMKLLEEQGLWKHLDTQTVAKYFGDFEATVFILQVKV